MGNNAIRRMTLDGVLIGLFLVLGLLRIRVGDFLEIGLGTIAITLAAISISPIDAIIIAGVGEFMNQVFFSGYGFTPTTFLWVFPVVLRAAILGFVAYLFKRKGDHITNHKVILFITIMGTALIISAVDTGLLLLDGVIMNYPVTFTWARTGIRVLTSQITAVVVALTIIPLHRAVSFILPTKKNPRPQEETSE